MKKTKKSILEAFHGALLEKADGGAWKHQCQQSIIEYLIEQFKNEIIAGKVIIG